VSRDGDRSEAWFVTPCASGVSTAVWPASERRHVATHWLAQQRRSFIMRGIDLQHVQLRIVQRLHLLYPLLLFALLLAGIVLAVLIFQYWVILFALATLWSVLIVIMTRLLCDKVYATMMTRLEHGLRPGRSQRPRPFSFASQFPVTPMPATPLIRVLETIDLSTMDVEHFIEDESDLQTSTQISVVQISVPSNFSTLKRVEKG
jgi:hypothetical protein